MILIICVDCKKVIGCGITEKGKIKKLCTHCYNIDCELYLHVPAIKTEVVLVHFGNACLGHYDHDVIGFHLNNTS